MVSFQGRGQFDTATLEAGSYELGKFIISHEIGHCYHHQTLDPDRDDWVAESFANYVATQTYPAANGEHVHLIGDARHAGFDLEKMTSDRRTEVS